MGAFIHDVIIKTPSELLPPIPNSVSDHSVFQRLQSGDVVTNVLNISSRWRFEFLHTGYGIYGLHLYWMI